MRALGPSTEDKLILISGDIAHFVNLRKELDRRIGSSTSIAQCARLIRHRNLACEQIVRLQAQQTEILKTYKIGALS